MPTAAGAVVIKKQFAYRGGTQVFSNRYWFNGGVPADNTAWNTLFDNVVAAEKLIYDAGITIIEAVGYVGGSTISAHSKSYTTAGTAVYTNPRAPGDCAALLRFSTAARTSKGHPIYLFNYFHGVCNNGGANYDVVDSSQVTKISTYGSAWLTGFSDGTNTYTRAGPRGADATSRLAETLITHRDFPR